MNMNFYFKIIMCFFHNSYLLCVIFFINEKALPMRKMWKNFIRTWHQFSGLFLLYIIFSWKLNSKIFIIKWKILFWFLVIFFLGLILLLNWDEKKFVKMKNSERFYGFCFFLFFRNLTQIVKQWLLARRAVSEKFIPRVITWYFHIQKTLSEFKLNTNCKIIKLKSGFLNQAKSSTKKQC